MDRKNMIRLILNDVDDWDLESLIDFAKVEISIRLSKMTDEQIASELEGLSSFIEED